MTNLKDEKEFYKLTPFIEEIRKGLKSLPQEHQVTFAAYCCECLFKNYIELSKKLKTNDDIPILRNVLNSIWNYFLNQAMTHEEIDDLLKQVTQINLGEEACCEEWDAAVNAVGAIWLAVEACKGDTDNKAAYVASNVLNRVDQRLMKELVGFSSYTSEEYSIISKKIEESHLMKDTKHQLWQVISLLRNQSVLDETIINYIRTKAEETII